MGEFERQEGFETQEAVEVPDEGVGVGAATEAVVVTNAPRADEGSRRTVHADTGAPPALGPAAEAPEPELDLSPPRIVLVLGHQEGRRGGAGRREEKKKGKKEGKKK